MPNETTEDQSNEEEQNGNSTAEEANSTEELDLADEAGKAAGGTPPKKDTRSLDDIELNDAQKARVDSYVNKAINDAVAKHDKRSQRKAKEAGTMSRDEVNALLEERDADNQRRVDARERLLSVLGEEGISPGSDGYKAVQQAYTQGVEEGAFTPHILTTDAGVRTLIAVAGASKRTATQEEGQQSGLHRSLPDTSILNQDGSVQLNAKQADEGLTLAQRVRNDIANQLRS